MLTGKTGLVLEQGVLAFYTATVTTPRTTSRTNTTIITSHMFWPIIIKLTSLPGKILWSRAGRRRERRPRDVNRCPSPSANRASPLVFLSPAAPSLSAQ
jgi:hypothetical protein